MADSSSKSSVMDTVTALASLTVVGGGIGAVLVAFTRSSLRDDFKEQQTMIEKRFDQQEKRYDQQEKRFDQQDMKFDLLIAATLLTVLYAAFNKGLQLTSP